MAVAAGLMVAQGAFTVAQGIREQERKNAQAYGNYLQGEHKKGLETDRANEKLNQKMQQSLRSNSQIADYSLTQAVANSQAVTRNRDQKESFTNKQKRLEEGQAQASEDSRNIDTGSGTAQALRRARLKDASDTFHALDMNYTDQLAQIYQQRKQQLASRDSTMYAPINFAPSEAPIPTDDTWMIIAGGMLGTGGRLAGEGYI